MDQYRLVNGVKIPYIGFGTWKMPQSDITIESIVYAVACGYTSIDTAAIYGNEESVGEGIRACGAERSELFVTTKLWNAEQGYDSTLRAFDMSLKRLGLDYLDLYLIHWPGKDKYIQTWKAFERLYSEKRVRAIGVSNFHAHHFETLKENTDIMPMVNQIELHPYLAQTKAEEYCRQNGILVEAWSPIMSGRALHDPVIVKIAEKHAKTPAQVILRWHHQHGRRPLSKSVTKERIKENISIFDFSLDDDDMQSINGLSSQNVRTGGHPDTFTMGFE